MIKLTVQQGIQNLAPCNWQKFSSDQAKMQGANLQGCIYI
jgi:hypothetical protein